MSAEFPPIPTSSLLDDLRRHLATVARQQEDDALLAELKQERPYDPARSADSRQQLVYWRAAVRREARRRGLVK